MDNFYHSITGYTISINAKYVVGQAGTMFFRIRPSPAAPHKNNDALPRFFLFSSLLSSTY